MSKQEDNKVEEIKNDSKVKKTVKKKTVKKKAPQITQYEDIEGKFLLVRVGTESNPASENQIQDIEKKLQAFLDDNGVNCMMFVTHHAVAIDIIGN